MLRVEAMTLDQWNKVMDTNVTGAFLFCQAVGKLMIEQKRGKIINIASVAGLRGSPPDFQAIGYQASKGALIAFTKDLACKWALHGVNVNAIAPGWFPTHMSEAVIGRDPEGLKKRIPLGPLWRRKRLERGGCISGFRSVRLCHRSHVGGGWRPDGVVTSGFR